MPTTVPRLRTPALSEFADIMYMHSYTHSRSFQFNYWNLLWLNTCTLNIWTLTPGVQHVFNLDSCSQKTIIVCGHRSAGDQRKLGKWVDLCLLCWMRIFHAKGKTTRHKRAVEGGSCFDCPAEDQSKTSTWQCCWENTVKTHTVERSTSATKTAHILLKLHIDPVKCAWITINKDNVKTGVWDTMFIFVKQTNRHKTTLNKYIPPRLDNRCPWSVYFYLQLKHRRKTENPVWNTTDTLNGLICVNIFGDRKAG